MNRRRVESWVAVLGAILLALACFAVGIAIAVLGG